MRAKCNDKMKRTSNVTENNFETTTTRNVGYDKSHYDYTTRWLGTACGQLSLGRGQIWQIAE